MLEQRNNAHHLHFLEHELHPSMRVKGTHGNNRLEHEIHKLFSKCEPMDLDQIMVPW